MPEPPLQNRRESIERDAREAVQARLALLTLTIWVILTFSLTVPLQLAVGGRAPLIIAIGFAALVVAALPWLLYGRLVEERLRRHDQPDDEVDQTPHP